MDPDTSAGNCIVALAARACATFHENPIPDGVPFDAMTTSIAELLGDPAEFCHAVILLGFSNPDACAKNPEYSHALNVGRTTAIVDEMRTFGVTPVFVSSESVFDGEKGNYVETDATRPILLYGTEKLEVERHIRNGCDDYLILRLARVYGTDAGDGTLFTRMLESLATNEDMVCATDQIFSPIHVEEVVEILVRLMDGRHSGLYHVAGRDALSRRQMLDILLAHYRSAGRSFTGTIRECRLRNIPSLEPRPVNVSMVPDKVIAATGVELVPLSNRLAELVFRTEQRARPA